MKDKNTKPGFNVDFLGYLCYLKGILKIEQNICFKRNQIVKFEKLVKFLKIYNLIYYICCMLITNAVLTEPAMYFCSFRNNQII